jgi:hypothetical protein
MAFLFRVHIATETKQHYILAVWKPRIAYSAVCKIVNVRPQVLKVNPLFEDGGLAIFWADDNSGHYSL